jgi:heparosan-N-sulfate-glucuronate 5-epimerase
VATASERSRERARGEKDGGRGYGGFFSSARTFTLSVGSNVSEAGVGGYYIDFSRKTTDPSWPPRWLRPTMRHVVAIQWALGCFERYLSGEGDAWLAGAVDAAEYLVSTQVRQGTHDGGWLHNAPMPHTFRLETPWLSAMAQGEAASLLVRVYSLTGQERFAEAATRALRPMSIPASGGGVLAELETGGFFAEEYPTHPPSHVLNGGIFALWGCYDVGIGLGLTAAKHEFEQGVDALARGIHRWDTGSWSRYDLFPHPVVNVASSSYHVLHINQLRAMQMIAPRDQLEAAAARFEGYWGSRANRARAFAQKALFRCLVPRNRVFARIALRRRAEPRCP